MGLSSGSDASGLREKEGSFGDSDDGVDVARDDAARAGLSKDKDSRDEDVREHNPRNDTSRESNSRGGSSTDSTTVERPDETDERLDEKEEAVEDLEPDLDQGPQQNDTQELERVATKKFWKFSLRARNDTGKQDWWFASTAIPLLAATLGPLANVISIAALVSYWRMDLRPDGWQPGDELLPQLQGATFKDPGWVYYPNVASLVTGYVGNLFLLANFTNRIRYIVALPATILLWYISTGLLMTILGCMQAYVPPDRPYETYTQGFWYGFIAAILYLICSMLLMVNMLGYFLGHYPQRFTLTESQRTLILQTMLFFIWLAGGAAVFSAVEGENQQEQGGWSFSDALYFCDVTILTVGFGDLHATTNTGRGLVLPYAVGGIIMLGLMISSISTFVAELSQHNIIDKRIDQQRRHTLRHTISSLEEAEEHSRYLRRSKTLLGPVRRLSGPFRITRPITANHPNISQSDFAPPVVEAPPTRTSTGMSLKTTPITRALKRTGSALTKAAGFPTKTLKNSRKPRLLLLREERDRFNAMRHIQSTTRSFKAWSSLTISVLAFAVLWAVGAIVFWQVEKDVQGMTYFQALYLGYVSLLTIGYGDLAPQSNAGRPFFVVWSLLAVPSVTILITNMGDTVIGKFKRGTNMLADFTVLPKYGIWRAFLDRNPWLLLKVQDFARNRAAKQRLARGFQPGPDPDAAQNPPPDPADEEEEPAPAPEAALERLAQDAAHPPSQHVLAKRLADAIRRTAADLHAEDEKTYSYEEWAEITQLIRFTRGRRRRARADARGENQEESESEDEGLIEWDWIGEDSPMMQKQSEAEFVLARLCESMARYARRQARAHETGNGEEA